MNWFMVNNTQSKLIYISQYEPNHLEYYFMRLFQKHTNNNIIFILFIY